MEDYYKKNREKLIKYAVKNLKAKGYANEKTPEQKMIRNIKRRTRYHFPLEGHFCELCGEEATEHHHNTSPIEFDKFNFLCHECHMDIHHEKGGTNNG